MYFDIDSVWIAQQILFRMIGKAIGWIIAASCLVCQLVVEVVLEAREDELADFAELWLD